MYQKEEIKIVRDQMIRLFDYPITYLTNISGLSRPTVSKFFNLKPIRPSVIKLLYELCEELISEKKEEMANRKKKKKKKKKEKRKKKREFS